jgi:hypothetical protein
MARCTRVIAWQLPNGASQVEAGIMPGPGWQGGRCDPQVVGRIHPTSGCTVVAGRSPLLEAPCLASTELATQPDDPARRPTRGDSGGTPGPRGNVLRRWAKRCGSRDESVGRVGEATSNKESRQDAPHDSKPNAHLAPAQ